MSPEHFVIPENKVVLKKKKKKDRRKLMGAYYRK
jgi:hypothetical protein